MRYGRLVDTHDTYVVHVKVRLTIVTTSGKGLSIRGQSLEWLADAKYINNAPLGAADASGCA